VRIAESTDFPRLDLKQAAGEPLVVTFSPYIENVEDVVERWSGSWQG
jgi:hypothetical protein